MSPNEITRSTSLPGAFSEEYMAKPIEPEPLNLEIKPVDLDKKVHYITASLLDRGTTMFKDTKEEKYIENSGVPLTEKPMDYNNVLSYVKIEDILFSQATISSKFQNMTINEIKCITRKIKLVFTLTEQEGEDEAFNLYIIGYFGVEGARGNDKVELRNPPQIPAIEVVDMPNAEKYISVNNRRLHAIHTLLYALTYNGNSKSFPFSDFNGTRLTYNTEMFKENLSKMGIKVINIFCPVIIYNSTDTCPSYLKYSIWHDDLNTREHINFSDWNEFLKHRFRLQKGCCNQSDFIKRGYKDTLDKRICPPGKDTFCDQGIDTIPRFSDAHYDGSIYTYETLGDKASAHYNFSSKSVDDYEDLINKFGISSNDLLTDETVIIPDTVIEQVSENVKKNLLIFKNKSKCLYEVKLPEPKQWSAFNKFKASKNKAISADDLLSMWRLLSKSEQKKWGEKQIF
jgi:hypothetical protein